MWRCRREARRPQFRSFSTFPGPERRVAHRTRHGAEFPDVDRERVLVPASIEVMASPSALRLDDREVIAFITLGIPGIVG